MNRKPTLIPFLMGCMLMMFLSSLSAQTDTDNVTIYIYHDANNNGIKDPDENYLSGFSLEIIGFDGRNIGFTETDTGIFKGYVARRARVIVNGYNDEYRVGNAEGAGSASVFFAEPRGGEVNYYVGVSAGLPLDPTMQTIILPCYEGGPSAGNKGPALIEFGYLDDGVIAMLGGQAPNPKQLTSIEETGATWGVGTQPNKHMVYTSALVKRHVGLGPKGIGGLYRYDLQNQELFSYDLSGMADGQGGLLKFGTITRKNVNGEISHDGSDDNTLTTQNMVATYDIDAFAKIGKTGIGAIDITDDESSLWMVNLHDRSLIYMDVSDGEPDFSTVHRYPIMEMSGLPDLNFQFVRNFNTGGLYYNGAEAFTDHNKVAWERNKYSFGGEHKQTEKEISNTMVARIGTSEKKLYQSNRQGEKFSYNIPVPVSDTYTVRLHFAEIDETYNTSGQRKFDVLAEENPILSNFNIAEAAGGIYKAWTEEFEVEVSDGELNLEFEGLLSGGVITPALISGIEIIGSQDRKVPSGELRPWGLTFNEGRGYVGMVADASISRAKDHLYGYVMSFDPDNPGEGLEMELSFPLKYPRERVSHAGRTISYPLLTSVWEAWTDDWESTGFPTGNQFDTLFVGYPQPVLSAIDFDTEGNMVIGLMDRWAHQGGYLNYPPVSKVQTFLVTYGAGDILKAFNTTEGYELEIENSDNIEYYRNDDGPSYSGEFFYNDYFNADKAAHGEIFTGGLGVMKGSDEVVLTVFNPIVTNETNSNIDNQGVYTQGTHVYSTSDGSKKRASLFVDQYQFGKANGLGDLAFGLKSPLINIGDYVWCDGNGDGIQQPDENGIPNVKLTLWLAEGGEPIDSTITDSEGLYNFDNVEANGNYLIKIDLSQSALDGFRREASPAFAGNDPEINSKGLDDLEPGFVIAQVNNIGLNYNYTFDFGLLGPEAHDVTRTECPEPGVTTVVFDLCEISNAVRDSLSPDNIVTFYSSEQDAIEGMNPIVLVDGCYYESEGKEELIAKVHVPGDELCYSLATVTLIVADVDTDITLQSEVCPGEAIDLNQHILLNQTGLMVFTNASMEPGDMITDLQNYTPASLPVTLYFKASFSEDCDAYGSLTINEIPSFEIELEDQASICEGEVFNFEDLNVQFTGGVGSIDQIYWTTNGTGVFQTGKKFAQAKYYTPSKKDIERGFVYFYLHAENPCDSKRIQVYLNIITMNDIRVECLPADTVTCYDERVADPYNPDFPKPTGVAGCDFKLTPVLNFVDIDMDHCDSTGDVASRIIRHWEFKIKDNPSVFCYDTIVVLRLPKLTPDAFIGTVENTFYCELEGVPNDGSLLKRYVAWKQPMGLHDYELPGTKLRGVTYELPLAIIEAGLRNALTQGTGTYNEYLKSVILRKADGTEITIGDIVSGDYMHDLIAKATNEQKQYGFLHALVENVEAPVEIILDTLVLNYYPYLLLQPGDWILSEGGGLVQVEEEWFYNGHGNSPYWFSGGWPSIYGNGECISYCDTGSGGGIHDDCIRIKVPSYNKETGFDSENCDTICLTPGLDLCGITIESDTITDLTSSCPQILEINTWITQTCWGATPNSCASDLTADEVDLVESYDSTGKGGIKIHLIQRQTFIDTLGPIFDFCYPAEWDQEEVQTSIRNGVIGSEALAWEAENPTTYYVGKQSCDAEVYVPDVQVIDNCSGVHSVKAMVDVVGGTRAVEMVRTATEIKILADGDTCFIYTYSHISDPIIISMGSIGGEVNEVRYEAADNCWNQSTWSKFIRIADNTPPTVVADRHLNFRLQGKKGWMNAIDIDEGSWDNCGEILVLARRVDWDEFCVGLCTGALDGVTTLEELNSIDPISVLDSGEVELYYKKMIEWLRDDESCGEKLVEGWIQGIRAHWAEHCGPVDEHGNPLIEVRGTFLGGGWSKKIPFGCEDICQEVEVELLVMDQWCNWGISRATVFVEDAAPAKELQALEDVTLSCEAYDKYYKSVLDLAEKAGDSDQDPLIFQHLDNLLGGYSVAWANNRGQAVNMNGDILPPYFNTLNTVCKDTLRQVRYQEPDHDNNLVWKSRLVPSVYLADISQKYKRGYIGVNCTATVKQDIWSDIDECGIGTIMRRFIVSTGCGENQTTRTYIQNIRVESSCPLKKEMFDWPEDVTVCLPLKRDENGDVQLPVSAVGQPQYTFPGGCRMMAFAHSDQVMKVSGQEHIYKVLRTHSAMDWCSGATVNHDQMIMVNDTCQGTDGRFITLAGTIKDPKNNFIPSVTLNAVTGQDIETTYSVNHGHYFLTVPHDLDMVYLDKNSSYTNGLSTLDLILIQRYLNDPSVFNNPFQKIAADVNNNGLVDVMDLIEIRDVIIGRKSQFSYVRPWKFVDDRNKKAFAGIRMDEVYKENNWVGVKMGDVNFDADYIIRMSSRSDREMYPFVVESLINEQGEHLVEVRMSQDIDLAGMQWSLDMSRFGDWSVGNVPSWIGGDMWHRDQDVVTLSWYSKGDSRRFREGEALMTFQIKGQSTKPEVTLLTDFSSEIYTPDLRARPVRLVYGQSTAKWTHKVYPNPTSQHQTFEIFSPEEKRAKISIHSIDGKKIEEWEVTLSAGTSKIPHSLNDEYVSGVYVYHILLDQHRLTGRFEIIR